MKKNVGKRCFGKGKLKNVGKEIGKMCGKNVWKLGKCGTENERKKERLAEATKRRGADSEAKLKKGETLEHASSSTHLHRGHAASSAQKRVGARRPLPNAEEVPLSTLQHIMTLCEERECAKDLTLKDCLRDAADAGKRKKESLAELSSLGANILAKPCRDGVPLP